MGIVSLILWVLIGCMSFSLMSAGYTEELSSDAQGLLEKAEQGDTEAQYNLANYYRQGKGVPQDYKKAKRATPTRGQAVALLAKVRSITDAGVVWRHLGRANNKSFLNEIQLAIEQVDLYLSARLNQFPCDRDVLCRRTRTSAWMLGGNAIGDHDVGQAVAVLERTLPNRCNARPNEAGS
jgi:hypothetical protein